MTSGIQKRKIVGAIILTVIWICCFMFIRPTLVIDFGLGIIMNFKLFVVALWLLVIFFYNLFYQSNTETTKLSWTVTLTMAWLALTIFYPFQPHQGTEAKYDAGVIYDGAVGFFDLLGGLLVCLLWVRFFSDEIAA